MYSVISFFVTAPVALLVCWFVLCPYQPLPFLEPAEGLLHSTSLHLPMAEGDAPLSAVDLDSLASTLSQAYGLPAEDSPHLLTKLLVDQGSSKNTPVSHFIVCG